MKLHAQNMKERHTTGGKANNSEVKMCVESKE
jgi:hypothetical protein